MEWLQYMSPIITAIGVIITAWFTYNQKTKDKLTDLKIEKYKRDMERESKRRSDNSSLVWSELYNILHDTGADRVYIIQPHPLGHEEKLSIYFEVKKKAIAPIKPHIQHLPISEVVKFNEMLVRNLFLYITDVDQQVEDKYAKSILSSYGCKAAIIKRLSDSRHDRNGSIVCEFIDDMEIPSDDAQKILHQAATNIQYILPPIIEEDEA